MANFHVSFFVFHVYLFFQSLQSHNTLSTGRNFLSISQKNNFIFFIRSDP